jgi:hypothetical protein
LPSRTGVRDVTSMRTTRAAAGEETRRQTRASANRNVLMMGSISVASRAMPRGGDF